VIIKFEDKDIMTTVHHNFYVKLWGDWLQSLL